VLCRLIVAFVTLSVGGCSDPDKGAVRGAGWVDSGVSDLGSDDDGGAEDASVDVCSDEESPCHANASCQAGEDGAECACKDGFEGDGITCSDIDECEDAALLECSENSTCQNTEGDYECKCDILLAGDGKVSCRPACEVALEDSDICDANGAACDIIDGAAACRRCQFDFQGDGVTCVFDQLCQDTCGKDAVCTDDGSDARTCVCPQGFEGEPDNPSVGCENVDECAAGIDDCDANSMCIDTVGGFVCDCLEGFESDGSGGCSNIDECANSALNDCDVDATCTDADPGWTCGCEPPFAGDGKDGCYCDLEGWWGMRQNVTLKWPDVKNGPFVVAAAGEYMLTVWELRRFKYSGGLLEVERKGCGSSGSPDFRSPLFGDEIYRSFVPNAVFDPFDVLDSEDWDLPGARVNSRFMSPDEVAVVGITLDDPANDPWPATRADVGSRGQDFEGDGIDGATFWPTGPENMTQLVPTQNYSYIPVEVDNSGIIVARAGCVSNASRVVSSLDGRLDSCTTITGIVESVSVEVRVLDCRLAPDWSMDLSCTADDWTNLPPCTDEQIDLLDDQEPAVTSTATFEMVQLSNDFDASDIDCDTVRSMLPAF